MTRAIAAARDSEAAIASGASTLAVGISTTNPMRVALERAGGGADDLCFVGPDDERAELVFVDARGPVEQWTEECARHTSAEPPRQVIVSAPDDSESILRAALRAGAAGCVASGDSVDEVLAAIRAVVAGGAWLSRSRLRSLLDEPRDARAGASRVVVPTLTARERDVLTLLAAGATQREIAKALFISPHTVRTHVNNMMRRLGARTCAEAVARACESGLLLANRREPSAQQP